MTPYGPAADYAEDLRDALTVAFAAAESNGGPPAPARTFVNEGLPVADWCDQCVVYVEALGVSLADGSGGGTLNRATVTEVRLDLAAQSMRCAARVDNAGNVTVTDAEASARRVNSDAYVMLNAVLSGVAAQTLFEPCQRVAVREVTGLQAEGGSVGVVMRISLTL